MTSRSSECKKAYNPGLTTALKKGHVYSVGSYLISREGADSRKAHKEIWLSYDSEDFY